MDDPFPSVSKHKSIFVVIRLGVSFRSFLPMSELAELGQEAASRQADDVLDCLRKSRHSTSILQKRISLPEVKSTNPTPVQTNQCCLQQKEKPIREEERVRWGICEGVRLG